MLFKSIIVGLAATQLAAGHGAIVKAVGDMGGQGTAIGIDSSTPRDGSGRNPFQADSTRFKNNNVDACGETLGGGPNEPAEQMSKMAAANTMPMVSQGGMLMMTLHQVNGDGAGPYECMIDSTGTGTGGWTKMEVATNVPGKNSRSKAKAEDFPLTAKIAADQNCTGTAGGMENLCMVRCNNAANAGPFGGCVPIMMMAGGAAPAGGAAAAPAAAFVVTPVAAYAEAPVKASEAAVAEASVASVAEASVASVAAAHIKVAAVAAVPTKIAAVAAVPTKIAAVAAVPTKEAAFARKFRS